MDPKDRRHQRLTRVARQLGTLIRRQAHGLWNAMQVAKRNEHGQLVWRFRYGPDGQERFLRVSHRAMTQGRNPSRLLFEQLQAGRWIERLDKGPETALLLTSEGQLRAWSPKQ